MKVSELLEARRHNWRALEEFCYRLERMGARRAMSGPAAARFASLYRGACADLALADAYQLPPNTVDYLHRLVGRAHNQLYRSSKFEFRRWLGVLFRQVPRQLYRDNCVRLAFAIFWGVFAASMFLSSKLSPYPGFAEGLLGREMMVVMEEMHNETPDDREFDAGGGAMGFYTWHNTSIGLRVFAWGLLLGVGGIYELTWNAAYLGSVFGYMSTLPTSEFFNQFVTAHGPFELTAIVLSAAVGMRFGFAIVATHGFTRGDSLWIQSQRAMPAMGATMALFVLAAMIEGFISPSALPYAVKAGVSVASSGLLMVYFVLLGRAPEPENAI
jgi:uncharacterized membrane protein SpoIIM required for sporulation